MEDGCACSKPFAGRKRDNGAASSREKKEKKLTAVVIGSDLEIVVRLNEKKEQIKKNDDVHGSCVEEIQRGICGIWWVFLVVEIKLRSR